MKLNFSSKCATSQNWKSFTRLGLVAVGFDQVRGRCSDTLKGIERFSDEQCTLKMGNDHSGMFRGRSVEGQFTTFASCIENILQPSFLFLDFNAI